MSLYGKNNVLLVLTLSLILCNERWSERCAEC